MKHVHLAAVTNSPFQKSAWIRLAALSGILINLAFSVPAEPISEGYFSGMDLEPVSGGDLSLLSSDPSAVLVFSLDADQATVGAFDAWSQQPHSAKAAVYGVVVTPKKSSPAVVDEALRQRDIKMPLFRTTEGSLLDGDKLRVLVIKGRDQQIVEQVDGKAIEAALSETVANPVAIATVTSATDTHTSDTAPKSSLYTNHRFKYVIRFPTGWDYRTSKNDDGAVGHPPNNSALDLRVWGLLNNETRDGKPGQMTTRDYAEQHLETLGEQTKAQVSIERRLSVTDGDTEGRDYSYTYVKPNPNGDGTAKYRGRIQVFEVEGMFKVANAEGPIGEYTANRDMIERFMVSFHPNEDPGDENETAEDQSSQESMQENQQPGGFFQQFR